MGLFGKSNANRQLNELFTDEQLIEISKKVSTVATFPGSICSDLARDINSKSEYKSNFTKIVDQLYSLSHSTDPSHAKFQTNIVAKFMVRHYTIPVLKFGNNSHRAVLINCVRLLIINGEI